LVICIKNTNSNRQTPERL